MYRQHVIDSTKMLIIMDMIDVQSSGIFVLSLNHQHECVETDTFKFVVVTVPKLLVIDITYKFKTKADLERSHRLWSGEGKNRLSCEIVIECKMLKSKMMEYDVYQTSIQYFIESAANPKIITINSFASVESQAFIGICVIIIKYVFHNFFVFDLTLLLLLYYHYAGINRNDNGKMLFIHMALVNERSTKQMSITLNY